MISVYATAVLESCTRVACVVTSETLGVGGALLACKPRRQIPIMSQPSMTKGRTKMKKVNPVWEAMRYGAPAEEI